MMSLGSHGEKKRASCTALNCKWDYVPQCKEGLQLSLNEQHALGDKKECRYRRTGMYVKARNFAKTNKKVSI